MSVRVLSASESQQIFDGKGPSIPPPSAKKTRGRPKKNVEVTELIPQPSTRQDIEQQIDDAGTMSELELARQQQIVTQNLSDNAILDQNDKLSKPLTLALERRDEAMLEDSKLDAPKKIDNIRFKALGAQMATAIESINSLTELSSAERGALLAKVVELVSKVDEKASAAAIEKVSEKLDALSAGEMPVEEEEEEKKPVKPKASKIPTWDNFRKIVGDFEGIEPVPNTNALRIGDSEYYLKRTKGTNAVSIYKKGDKQKDAISFPIDAGFYSVMTALDGVTNIDDRVTGDAIKLAKYLIKIGVVDSSQLPEKHQLIKTDDEEDQASSAPQAEGEGKGKSTEVAPYYIGKTDYEKGFVKIYKTPGPKDGKRRPKAVYVAPLSPDLVNLLSSRPMSRTKSYSAEAIKAFRDIYDFMGDSMNIGRQSAKWAILHDKPVPQSRAKTIAVPTSVPEMARMLKKNIESIKSGNTNKTLKRQSSMIVDQLLAANVIDEIDAAGYREDIQ